jgi:hypothetical protein
VLTLAKLITQCGVLLVFACLSSSSNRHNTLSFWHVIQGHANVVQSFLQFPKYYNQHIKLLPEPLLATLARHNYVAAQLQYSLQLLDREHAETAKLFWLAGIYKMSQSQRGELALKLYQHLQWDDLNQLKSINMLSNNEVVGHLQLHNGVPASHVNDDFINKLGFETLNTHAFSDQNCLFNVLMMSDHRTGLYKLAALSQEYNTKPEPKSDTFCFSNPVYVAGEVKCKSTDLDNATCALPKQLFSSRFSSHFDFIVMMTKQGSASVSRGIMQLNSQVNYNLFLHELMHFNGFEDEYVLPKNKQQWLCNQKGFVAPNLFIANGVVAPRGWFKSRSCQHASVAYKPSKGYSIMEYQQVGLSDEYRQLWQRHLKNNSTDYKQLAYTRYTYKQDKLNPLINSNN